MVTCANRVILLAYARRGTHVYYINYKFFCFLSSFLKIKYSRVTFYTKSI